MRKAIIVAAALAAAASAFAAAPTSVGASLDQALRAGEKFGKPLSAKFENVDGAPRLSVWTLKGGAYSEVIVDLKTGKAAPGVPIVDATRLADAQSQAEAMAKAKITLRTAVRRALKKNPDTMAIAVFAVVNGGVPIGLVKLAGSDAVRNAYIKLDEPAAK